MSDWYYDPSTAKEKTIGIDDGLWSRVVAEAEKQGVSVDEFLHYVLRNYFEPKQPSGEGWGR